MSYPISNQKIAPNAALNQSQQSMGINYDQVPSASDVNQAATSNPLWRVLGSPQDVFVTGALTVPTWMGIHWLLHRFQEACKDTSAKPSILKRMAAWGDKVASHGAFSNKFFEGISKTFARVNKFFSEKIIGNSRILRSIFRTPTEPVSGLVTNFAHGAASDIASGASQGLTSYVSKEHNPNLEDFVNGKSLSKVKEMGFDSVEEFEEVLANSHKPENIRKMAQACEKLAGKTLEIPRAFQIPFTDKYLTDFLPKSVSKFIAKKFNFSALAQQLNSLADGKYAKTALGRFLPKMSIKVIQSLTFGLGGIGAIGLAFNSIFVASAINKSVKAEKGDKFKTFMENIFSMIGWYLTIPLAIGMISHVTGLKHIGLAGKTDSANKLEEYNKAWKDFNKKVAEGKFKSKAEYQAAKKAVQGMLKTKWYLLPFKWFGTFFSMGRETLMPYVPKNATQFGRFMKKLPYYLKKGGGFPVRALPYFLILAPFFDKISVKASHMLFGRPKHSLLDEDKEEGEKSAADTMNKQVQGVSGANAIQQAPVEQAQPQGVNEVNVVQQNTPQTVQQQQQPQVQTQPTQNNIQTQTPTTVVPPVVPVGQPAIPSQNQPAVHAQHPASVAKTEPTNQGTRNIFSQEPVRRYIPSSAPVRVNPQQYQLTPQAQSALGKASAAERNADRFIGGKSE